MIYNQSLNYAKYKEYENLIALVFQNIDFEFSMKIANYWCKISKLWFIFCEYKIKNHELNTFEFNIFRLILDGRTFDCRGFAEIRMSLNQLHKLNIFYSFIIIIIINSMVSIVLPHYRVLGFIVFHTLIKIELTK